ncbi:putative C-5 sterol desaturase [Podospora appendiculata]|uniref:C-5 sterol desaturase n=1 Tax=Podospora appendiculata TaxID=314037 RepID=A0AAE0XFT1_9PEZI|nr:putative C-5 sterol desaturase [Podospora appendiculata]
MDIVLEVADTFMFDYMYAYVLPARAAPYDYPSKLSANATAQAFSPWQYKPSTAFFSLEPSSAAYASGLTRDNIYRQSFSFFLILWIFGFITYYVFATLSYIFVFDKKTLEHPKFLKNQVWLEIKQANAALPVMAMLTFPFLVAEVRGYSKLYDTSAEGPGTWYDYFQFPLFLLFTDFCIYFIHRGLHHPWVYKTLHKPHHKWIMPTPYASHAFNPFDGYAQSLPYHIFPFIFPLQKLAYVGLFVFINFWTIMIHDGEYYANNPILNGAACHSIHHFAFNYNYGQYTTLWDRLGGSYRAPDEGMFQKDIKMSKKQWEKQVNVMETILAEVEGEDDRVYEPKTKKTQ